MRNLVIRNADKLVLNAVELDAASTWSPPNGTTLLPTNAGNVGDTWDGGTGFVTPPPVVDAPFEADRTLLRDFMALNPPTQAQAVAAEKAIIRMLYRIARELA